MQPQERQITKSKTRAVHGLGDTEAALLSGAANREGRLITAPGTMKPATRQRAAANLIQRAWAEERPAKRGEPAWREEEGRRIALVATAAGLGAIGIEEESEQARPDSSKPDHPQAGSKGELVIGLLSRPEGAGIGELMGATGWLAHSTRAVLSGLRKRGYEIGRERDPDGSSRYRIVMVEATAAAPVRGRGRRSKAAEARAAA